MEGFDELKIIESASLGLSGSSAEEANCADDQPQRTRRFIARRRLTGSPLLLNLNLALKREFSLAR